MMQKVITINLNGNAYQIEEAGYGALVGYLDGAQRQLRDNPDRMEIIGDLEQAIADKCARFRGPQKSVVTSSEVDQIIREMGPVEAATGSETAGQTHAEGKTGPKAPRRLYLIREGAMLAGLCNGIAAYFGIDPTIVRVLFVLLALGTKGAFIFIYVVLAIVIPSADTSEERAAAYGEMFNARELIDRAAKNFKEGGREWNRSWRRQHRRWRRHWRKSAQGAQWAAPPPPPLPPPGTYATRVLAGFMVPVLSIVSALFFWICAYAILSLVTMREAFGILLPDDVPLWVGIVVLFFLYQSLAWPLHAARRASYQALGGPHHASVAALDGMLSLGIALLVVWFAYNNVPAVRDFLRALPQTFDSMQR
jgi:phage shock protein PspC (stress-responsive transcriptional regulator)